MTTLFDYALMAGAAYISNRVDVNKFPIPQGWFGISNSHVNNVATGFEAITFTNGSEIVISFAGTNGFFTVDQFANLGLATGAGSDQLLQAVDYYLTIKAANPTANITFTGHSLGGGIAALMGVFFGKQTVTFDQAPFANTAEQGLLGTASYALNLQTYLIGKPITDPALSAIRDTLVTDLGTFLQHQQTNGGIPNSDLVSTYRVSGEFTSSFPVGTLFDPIGAPASFIQHGSTSISAVTELHSQALLTAFLQSGDTPMSTATDHTLGQVTFKLTDLLAMFYDNKLFAHPTDLSSLKENFLERLVKHQAGIWDAATGTSAILTPDQMVTRFTADLWKLAQDGGITLNDDAGSANMYNISKALIAFAMQFYYEDTANATDKTKQLFTDLSTANEGSNGIRFDIHDVSTAAASAIDANQKIDFTAKINGNYVIKGYQYFKDYLSQQSNQLTDTDKQLIQSLLPHMRDWYVQAGASGMVATDTLNRGAFMLGGTGGDALVGGTKADLLVGNGGDDELKGGLGNDFLLGGKGNDTYRYNTGDGFDTILDSDGTGSIVIDGATLAGGDQYGDDKVHRGANKHLYVDVGNGRMVIDGNILIENYQAGQLGLTMATTPVAEPTFDRTITGDLKVIDFDETKANIQWQKDDLGNLMTDPEKPESGRSDLLTGSAGNDLVIGGGGSDILNSKGGDDRLYADSQMSVAEAIALGNSQGGSGQKGDWLNADAGDDILIGSNGNDALFGGVGSDILISGAGDDFIVADNESIPADGFDPLAATYDPEIRFNTNGSGDFFAVYNIPPSDSGTDPQRTQTDVIYAGEGNDYAEGGRGNDVIFGENGTDFLRGNSGNDIILGGKGKDILHGDTTENVNTTVTPGNDYLDGGENEDTLYGNEGDDIIIGGTGVDTLYGGTGKDTYIFNRGDGGDTVYDTRADNNIFRFGAGISSSDITLRLGSLMLDLGNGDSIHIAGFNQSDVFNSSSIGSFEFTDGSILTTDELLARGFDLDGTVNGDTINGTNTTDRINGLSGNDSLFGMAGNDTLNGGDGNDQLVGDDGTVAFSGNDLINGDAGDDYIWGNGGDDMLNGGTGNDILQGETGNDSLIGGDGNDQLAGGAGNDTLSGGVGDDIYYYNLGEGIDHITDSGGTDRLVLGNGATIANLRLDVGSLKMVFSDGSELHLDDFDPTNPLAGSIENFQFSDGQVYTREQMIQTLGFNIQGGSGDSVLSGTALGETITAYAGNDTVTALGGNDTVNGGAGNDTLYGDTGADNLLGGLGDDLLAGGADNDTLDGGAGNDTYLFGRGAGQDVVYDNDTTVGNFDKIQIAADVLPSDVTVGKNGVNLYLSISNPDGTTDKLTLANWFGNGVSKVGEIVFADGTVWNEQTLNAMLGIATEGADIISGTSGDDVINGLGGDDTLYGNAGNDTLNGGAGVDTMLGGQDNDTYIVDVTADVVTENANEGTDTVQSSATYTLGANIENLTLTGVAAINGTGNALNNILTGNSAANVLTGGLGNDTYVISSGDLVVENANEGIDAVQTDITYTLTANLENLTLTGISSVNGTGNASNNILIGNSASNTLDGQVGADTLIGGAGNDTYVVDNSADVVTENANEGADAVLSSATYTLSANIESLTLTGTGAINGTGNSQNNTLTGNSGANVLSGGSGDDTYVIQAGDTVVENANEGVDSVQSALTYTLGANVENLTLTGTATINGTGNASNNIIMGNAAKNTLTGGTGDDTLDGGAGVDTMIGGIGNDYYVIENTRDAITENANEGIDTVQTSFTYTLGDNFENLVLAPNVLINGTGNASNNIITGNALDNILDGAAGADTLIGGAGNDTYIVDNSADVITENVNEGTDAVQSSVTYALSANIENLALAGTAAINGTGNNLNNTLTGNSGANVLSGGGGDDTYVIGTGDTVVENANEGVDTIQSSVTFILGANVENLTLTGTSVINGTGNNLANILTGDGNTKANVLTGGLGDDTYILGAGDTAVENANEGIDTVLSSATFTLGVNLENLTLTGTGAINGTGNTLNNVLTGNSAANVLSGGAGDDTYFVGAGDTVVENLNQGVDTVQSSANFTIGANIENLILTGSTALTGTGNTLNDVITGNAQNNVLDGGAGADTMTGGLGDDTYVVDNATDIVVEYAGGGNDTVQSYISFISGGNVENVTLLGTAAINATGDDSNNMLTGNSAANTLTGGAGDDTLNGGGGADILIGGLGNDIYVATSSVTIVENANEGTDTLQSTVTATLSDNNIENLTLTGTAAINGTGNSLNNVITGNAGNNILDGGTGTDTIYGGDGNDTLYGVKGEALYGGNGDDTYIFTGTDSLSISDIYLFESWAPGGGLGVDTIMSNGSVSLATGNQAWPQDIENITLTGTGNTSAKGNGLNNVLTGNSGNNLLYCGNLNSSANVTLIGGAGDDSLYGSDYGGTVTMIGGIGNDYYTIFGADVATITENLNDGIDTVDYSHGTSYTLAANVENLVVWGATGIGNTLNNVITSKSSLASTLYGMEGDDTLVGNLNSTADTLAGGTGNDTYVIDTGDVITENLNEGIDTVQSFFTYTLGANLENLTLTGTVAINGTGNTLNNVINDNSANNLLNGGQGNDTVNGSAGNDVLEGADGNDTLSDTAGNNLFNGGAGTDTLTGNTGKELFIGGLGNDIITTGTGADIIAFNKGDGQDTIVASTGTDNTISLGGGIQYANLSMSKSGNNLILNTGNGDQIIMQNWYSGTSNHSVANLQLVLDTGSYNASSADPLLNRQVQDFNFALLAQNFDQALVANPTLTSWNLTDSLLSAHLSGSDTAALGGDLAYQYNLNGSLTGIGLASAQTELGSASFGVSPQQLQPLASLQTGTARLG